MGKSDPSKNDPHSGATNGTHGIGPSTEKPGDNERWLHSAIQNSLEIVKIVDPDGTLRYASPAFQQILGYDPAKFVGSNLFDYVHPDDLPHILEETEKALSAGGIGRNIVEYRFRHADGSWRWIEAVGTYLLDDPAVRGVVVNARDVTERKQAEEALAESERRYARLLSNEPALVYRCLNQASWPMVFVSDFALELTGYSPEEFLRGGELEYGSLVIEEDRQRVWKEVQEALADSRRFRLRYTIRRKDGAMRHVEEYGQGVFGENGKVEAIEGLIYDVTEGVWVEARLREAEEKYRTLVEQIPAITYIEEMKGSGSANSTLYMSPQIEEMLGYTSEEWLVGLELWGKILHPDDRERVLAEDRRTDETGEPFRVEYRAISKNGKTVWVRDEAVLLGDEGGSPRFWQGVMFDITERKRAEEALQKNEERYRTVVEEQTELVCRFLPDLTLTFVNEAYCRYFGRDMEDLIGKSFMPQMPEEDRIFYEEQLSQITRDSPSRTVEHRVFAAGGEVRWQQWTDRAIFDAEGRIVEYQSVGRDITERREAEEALKYSEARLMETQRLASLGGWEWDIEAGEFFWSDEVFRIYGFSPQEFVPSLETMMQIVHPEDRESVKGAIHGALYENEPYDIESRMVRPSGEVRTVHRRAEVVRGKQGEPLRMVGTVHDITERKRAEEQVHYQAFHDSLTGLPNRQLFVDRLGQALRRTRRKKNSRVAVIFLDLDDFKVVNDSLGHETGDLLLIAVSERLRRCLRPEDTLARFGGDEFVVLLEDVGDSREVILVAERVTDEFSRPFVLEGRQLFTGFSIGIGLGDAHHKAPEDLLRDADTAMYEAKGSGSGYRLFDPTMYERVVGRLELENDLRRGVQAGEFVVHYQPIVSLRGGEVRGMEALVRWEHPERGMVDPGEFVSVAEESSFIIPIGEQVLEEACQRAREWQEKTSRTAPLVVSVNLSAKQLQHPDLAGAIKRVLRETGLQASQLSLDITETVYVAFREGNTTALDELRRLGVGVSIDDFGTGYSSLSYLKRLPANVVKIDKVFVAGLGKDMEDTAIVRMIIQLAKILGMEVVAEGVESEQQVQLLKGMGCDMAQGYYFSEPLPAEAVPRFLNSS